MLQRPSQLADRPTAAPQHHQHHLVASFRRRGERAPQRGEKRCLQRAEPVVPPAAGQVVIRYAVAQQLAVVQLDEFLLDCRPGLGQQAGGREVRQIPGGQSHTQRLPVHHRDARPVGIEQHVVQPVVTVHQGEAVRLDQQPRRHQCHCGAQGVAVFRDSSPDRVCPVSYRPPSARPRPCRWPPPRRALASRHRGCPPRRGHTRWGRADPPGPPPPAAASSGVHPPIWSPWTAGAMSASSRTKSAPSLAISQWKHCGVGICHPVRHAGVERVLGAVSDGDAFPDGFILSGQLDRERAGQLGLFRCVRGRHAVGRAGLTGADRRDGNVAHVDVQHG